MFSKVGDLCSAVCVTRVKTSYIKLYLRYLICAPATSISIAQVVVATPCIAPIPPGSPIATIATAEAAIKYKETISLNTPICEVTCTIYSRDVTAFKTLFLIGPLGHF